MKDITPRLRVLTSVALLLAVFALQVPAQTPAAAPAAAPQQDEPGRKGLDHTDGPRVNTIPSPTKRYALVIGVDKYDDTRISALNGAANDARALRDALVRYAGFLPEKVRLLTSDQPEKDNQPSRNNILEALFSLRRMVEKDSMIVVAFSGHGIEQDGVAYLMGQDAKNYDDMIRYTGISVNEVTKAIKDTRASQVMLILDACRNDPNAGGRGDKGNALSEAYTRAVDFDGRNSGVQAFVTLYATSVGQQAWENVRRKQGYFSMAIVEALKGEARNDRGEVTLQALLSYVEREVETRVKTERGKEQKPYSVVSGYKANELVIAAHTPPAPPPSAAPRPQPVPAAPVTGSLTVVSEFGAHISLKPAAAAPGAKPVSTLLPGEQRSGVFENLQPARYVATVTREGFAPATAEVEVAAGKQAKLEVALRPLLYSVKLRLNVTSGRVEFGPRGEPRQVIELQGGQATLANLRRGDYLIRVIPDEVGYLSKTETVAVGSDLSLEYKLERRLREQPFVADFGMREQWALPAGWGGSQVLDVTGPGVAILRDDAVRYANLQLNASVKLTNGAGVSFVVRAVDEKNYYLVRVGGAKAEPANKLRLFVVKNGGEPQLLGTLPLGHYKLDDVFLLIVRVTDNRFDFVLDDNTGATEVKTVGTLFDSDRTFASGTLGVAAAKGDQARIMQLLACPDRCPDITEGPPARQ
ncbi:MAG TPA: caspase family protein [Pyrinomonadaceae bacterium]|nr:caspase family protein [Pyrinomonadaceae bacterium]